MKMNLIHVNFFFIKLKKFVYCLRSNFSSKDMNKIFNDYCSLFLFSIFSAFKNYVLKNWLFPIFTDFVFKI